MAALLRVVVRHPVLTFMVIGLGAGFLTAAIRPIAEAEVLPFDLPLHGFLGGVLGVGLGAFVVTGALAGRDGVVDLARRSVRWWVPVRWYLVALFTVPVGVTLIAAMRERVQRGVEVGKVMASGGMTTPEPMSWELSSVPTRCTCWLRWPMKPDCRSRRMRTAWQRSSSRSMLGLTASNIAAA
ncbi:MAG TPA: hypothetical protein VF241_12395 [Propionibacteriaceae bacterium]